MKLATKLLLAPLVTGAVALGTGGLSTLTTQWERTQASARFESDLASLRSTGQAQHQIAEVHAAVYRTQALIESLSAEDVKAFKARTAEQLQKVQATIGAMAVDAGGDEALRNGIGAAAQLVEKYRTQSAKAIDLTSVDVNMGVSAMKAAEQTHVELVKAMEAVLARKEVLREGFAQTAARRFVLLTVALGGLGLLFTVGALAWAWRAQRRIVQDVRAAAALAAQVAQGNLVVPPARAGDREGRDEIAELMRSLHDMVLQLRDSLQTVRVASDSIRIASQEIASGNADLSQRTEQAAAHLQQTAGAMEQLTSNVAQTADAAASAKQLASGASDVAARGGSAVAQVVGTMDEIQQSSRRIGDIIGVIDGIAFQTNILALNAAVEAARAGEQGRGFAVVAGEVRSLAQRSAEAAREIKALIGASVDTVQAGAAQVHSAGATMDEIVASVRRVTDIVGEISTAAAEQHGGIADVNRSVSSLDRSTQQNAALVEQSAAAAESLQEQAARLAGVVGRFQLGAEAAPPAAAAPLQAPAVERRAPAATPATPAAAAPAPRAPAVRPAAPRPAAPRPARAAAAPAVATASADGDWETL